MSMQTSSLPQKVAVGENLLHWPRASGPCKRVVLFVHGFKGDKEKTWAGASGESLYSLTFADTSLADFEVMSYGYRTGFGLRMPPIATLSTQFQNELQRLSGSHEQIVICAHSMGGVVAMQAIIDALASNRTIKISGLILYGTPLEGSGLVNLAQILLKLGSIKTALLVPIHFIFSRQGSQFNDLRKGSDLLFRLREAWTRRVVNGGDPSLPATQRADFPVRVVSGTGDMIVSEMSAKTFFGDCDWCPIDFDHIELVKPTDKSSSSFLALHQFLTLSRSNASLQVRRRLREIAESILKYRLSKLVCDWTYEVEFLERNTLQEESTSLFDNPLFATTHVKVCRYQTILSRPQVDIVFAFGSTAEAQAWEDDPAYVHFIHVDSVRQDEKIRINEAVSRAFKGIAPEAVASSLAVFRTLSVSVQKKGDSAVHRLTSMSLVKLSQSVVCRFQSDDLLGPLVGSDVILDISFQSVRPVSIPSFTLEFPWLTSCVSAILDVTSAEDVSVSDHVFPSEGFAVSTENLGKSRRVRVGTKGVVLPESFVRVSWQA